MDILICGYISFRLVEYLIIETIKPLVRKEKNKGYSGR